MERIMYIEYKGDGLVGEARIGRVKFSKTKKSIHYRGKTYKTLSGSGFKSNYFDVETRAYYWISGCRKDGKDRLYG
ncbi:MAG: 1-deoxy-D-xylulose-5-phosphate synthase, partial [Bacteroidota bacterium]